MSSHVYVLVLFHEKETRVEGVYINRRDAEVRKKAINTNASADRVIEGIVCDKYHGSPTAAVIKQPLHGEDQKLLKLLEKIDKAQEEVNETLWKCRRHAKNRSRSRRQTMLDRLLGD